MISALPAWSRIRNKIVKANSLAGLADEVVEISPSSESYSAPIIHLPDDPDRWKAFTPGMSIDQYHSIAAGGSKIHAATIGRCYKNARIIDGTVYLNNAYEAITDVPRRGILISKSAEISNAMLATNYVCEKYFGHWLTDGQALELLADDLVKKPMGLTRAPWTDEPFYRSMTNTSLELFDNVKIENLWIVDDMGANVGRVERSLRLRKRIRAQYPELPQGAPVFLKRVGGKARLLVNQDELAEKLARRGFAIATPHEERPEIFLPLLLNAPFVISVEGSALCHAIMTLPHNSTVFAIQPPSRVDWILKAHCDIVGLRYAQATADTSGEGFYLSEDRLLRTIDLFI
ncbi:glycosyltransferase 61 family protein [Sphingobium boeckii]|uniref:Glycosyltransferase 61 catalytic domain-containing protein n=1 Tax=Sphingobium boeckii TaxID=1082345 RepID=A0A7W9AKA9_9SPHN|nr:glycosyltransferase family 61 protein [Sphingobium boeckii]MBB5686994.1 hypothetical protein [Sphingobium boeckii]